MFVVSDSDPGIEVLHGPMEVFFSCRGDDVIMIGHKNHMVDIEVEFLVCFFKRLEENTDDFAPIEFKRSVVGPCDQVVGIYVLYDAQRPSHG